MSIKNNFFIEKQQVINIEIENKIKKDEDIYFGELALSRINEPKFTSEQVREELEL